MSTAGLIWMILFYLFTFLFFIIAFVAIVFGFRDLRELLVESDKNERSDKA